MTDRAGQLHGPADEQTPIAPEAHPPLQALCSEHGNRLIKQLATNPDFKVRISAALSLERLRDACSIEPFLAALQDDHEAVRTISAKALAKLVDETTSNATRANVLAKLKEAATTDADPRVRAQAQESHDAIAGVSP